MRLDNALGTELARRGVEIDGPGWTAAANRTHPDDIIAAHEDAIRAGAMIVTANTFRTHQRNLDPLGLDAAELTPLAVNWAGYATEKTDALVFGSAAPLADCYDASAAPPHDAMRDEHARHAELLAAAHVDGILVETMTTIREAAIATRAARTALGDRPVFASVAIARDGRLYSGEPLADAIIALRDAGADMTLANCFPASLGRRLAETFAEHADCWGLYANTGMLDGHGRWAKDGDISPQGYARHAADWIAAGATLVGGCCGTTPDHTAAIRDAIARDK